MACLRVLVLMVSVGFCKSSHSWVKPTEGYSTSKNFLDAGACDEIVEISAASEDGVTITTVPDPSDLFFIQLSLTKYVDYLHCDQDRIPDQSTTFTVTLSATKAGEEPVIRTITVNHVIPGAANSADPMFADNSSSAISINRNDAANTLVTTFVVTDDDGDTVTLSIPDGAPFQVTGMQISTSSSLENENSPYELEIVATDDGDPPRSSTWTLTITLLNECLNVCMEDCDVNGNCHDTTTIYSTTDATEVFGHGLAAGIGIIVFVIVLIGIVVYLRLRTNFFQSMCNVKVSAASREQHGYVNTHEQSASREKPENDDVKVNAELRVTMSGEEVNDTDREYISLEEGQPEHHYSGLQTKGHNG